MQENTVNGLSLKKQGPDTRQRAEVYNAVIMVGFRPTEFAWTKVGSKQSKVESLYLRSRLPSSAKRCKQLCRAPRDKCGT